MAAGKWLDEIRARVAARGVAVADLARAAGMERSNLRRLLSNTAATPRLGTVMRLLAPLDSWVTPPGARTAGELMLFLDGERDRHGASWEALLVGSRLAAATFTEYLSATPERLPLDVVLHVADSLEIELKIAETHDPPAASHEAESTKRPRRRGGSRSSRGRSRPAPRPTDPLGPASVAPTPHPVDTTLPREQSFSSSPWRLCPPRLGRYRAAPPPPPASRAPAVAPYVPPEPTYALEHTILHGLADMSRGTWRDLFCGLHETITGTLDAPLDFFDDLATRTERWLRRFRRSADSKPQPRIQVPVEDVDPMPFVDAWCAMKSDPDRQTTQTIHDWAGRAYVFHPAVSGTHTVQILLGQDGRPNRLAALIEVTSDDGQVIASPDLRLELKVGDAVYPFTHYHAGPVFGGIGVNNRVYLLGAMSSMLALIEVTRSRARTVWAGFAEDLEKTPLEVALADDPPAPISDDRDPDRGPERDAPQHADLEAELAAARRMLAEERARGAAAQQRADEAAAALASSERERIALQQRLEAGLAEARRALAEEHTHRAAAQRRADETAIALALSQHERQTVQTQLEAERSARTEGERLVEASVKEVVRIMLLMLVELTETRRRLAETEQALQDASSPRRAASAPTNDESLNEQPPIPELPAGEVVPLEDTTTDAADEAPQAHVEEVAASALHVESPRSYCVTMPSNDPSEQPEPGPLEFIAPAAPTESELDGVPANQLDDFKSEDEYEVEVACPTIPAVTTEIDAALAVRLEAASTATPDIGTESASVADGARDRGVVPAAPEQGEPVGAAARQHVDETSANTREMEAPLDAAPGFDIKAAADVAPTSTPSGNLGLALAVDVAGEANCSPDSDPAAASPAPAAVHADDESPASATTPHRIVVIAGQDRRILADKMVPAELLAFAVSAWMLTAPNCHIYVDGYLVSDTLRATAGEPERVADPDAAVIDRESREDGRASPVAATAPPSESTVTVEPQPPATESTAKRRSTRTVTASTLPSVEPPHPPDPPKPRLAKSLTKKWRR